MTVSRTGGLARAGIGLIFVLASCSSKGSRTDAISVEQVCADYDDPGGNIGGDNSLEQNQAHLRERIQYFRSLASLLEERAVPALASNISSITSVMEEAAAATTNTDLYAEIIHVTTDPALVAIGQELDEYVVEMCSESVTSTI
ncbi:MAG: hypothetical protein AAB131_17165 [Actinomycetota bacterium]